MRNSDEMIHFLGESCGPLTLDDSYNLLNIKDNAITELEKKVCQLESDLSNEKEQHSVESDKLNALLIDKDVILHRKVEELEQRPTQKIVNDLRKKLRLLEVNISEKTSQLEAAEEKISELSTQDEKPAGNKWIKRIFSIRGQEAGTSKMSKSSSSNNRTSTSTPVVSSNNSNNRTGTSTPVVSSNNSNNRTSTSTPVVSSNNRTGTSTPVVSSNNRTSTSTPVVQVAISKKLVFFKKGDAFEFGLECLLRASAEVLGKGTFGTSYKVILESGGTLLVKRLSHINLSENEFRENVARIGKLDHENILPLLAYYYSRRNEKLLVYDFIKPGSLSNVLHGGSDSGQVWFNWETRAKVILSVSNSLSYIHSTVPTFCHGNIKSSNVLLTYTYKALLSDHGIYFLSSNTRYVNGYKAPEITDLGKMSQEADVYSFGMLVIEIITRKSPNQTITINGETMNLVRWVLSLASIGKTEDAFDAELAGSQRDKKDMKQLMQLALDCTTDFPVNRPRMTDVVGRIEEILRR